MSEQEKTPEQTKKIQELQDYNKSEVHILIVDDSSFSRQTISQILSDDGFSISGDASTESEAWSALHSSKCDIIIMDVVMPETNGITLTKQILDQFKDAAVIMISSLTQEHIIIEAIGAGASDFIQKPFEKLDLLEAVDKIARQLIETRL